MTISLIINAANQWDRKKIMSKTTVKQENFMKNLQYYIKKYPIIIKIWVDTEWLPYITINLQYYYGTNAGTNSKRGGNSETEKDLDDHHRNGIYCSISRGRQLC